MIVLVSYHNYTLLGSHFSLRLQRDNFNPTDEMSLISAWCVGLHKNDVNNNKISNEFHLGHTSHGTEHYQDWVIKKRYA